MGALAVQHAARPIAVGLQWGARRWPVLRWFCVEVGKVEQRFTAPPNPLASPRASGPGSFPQSAPEESSAVPNSVYGHHNARATKGGIDTMNRGAGFTSTCVGSNSISQYSPLQAPPLSQNRGETSEHERESERERALLSGSSILAETLVITLAIFVIVVQSSHAERRNAQRASDLKDDVRVLQGEIDTLRAQLRSQEIVLDDFVVPYGLKPRVLQVDGFGRPSGKPE